MTDESPAAPAVRTTETDGHEWSLLDLFEMGEAAASLIAAHRVGLLDALLDHADSPEGFAATLGLDTRATRLVLNVLWTYGTVELTGERFRASAGLAQIHRVHPGGVSVDLDLFDHEPMFLRTGAPKIRMDGSVRERETSFALLSSGLANMFRPASRELARWVRQEFLLDRRDDEPSTRILDLGAGSGVWGTAMLEELPGSHLTAIDLPQVAEQLRRRLSARRLTGRADVVSGSYFDVPVPERCFDVVVLGNVLHLEPTARARRLVGIAAGAVQPDGVLIVIDVLAREPYETSRRRAMYALSLALRTEDGHTYSANAISDWLGDAGLTEVRRLPIAGAPSHIDILTARRYAREPNRCTGKRQNEAILDG